MKLIVSFLAVFLSACSSLPVEIQQAPDNDRKLYQMINSVSNYQGISVRWGGEIISIETDGAHSTLEIKQFPLNRYGFPLLTHPSQGVFIAQTDEFLEPEKYQQGLLITLFGTITSEVTKVIKRKNYNLPIITISKIHIWPYGEANGEVYTHQGVESRYTGYGYYGHGSSDNYR